MAVSPDQAAEPIAPLLCGRDAALVWERASEGVEPDDHERGCPHCRAAFADAGGLHLLVNRMAEEDLEPPPSVLERAMQAVRAEIRQRDLIDLDSPHGPARVARPAAAGVLRHAVDQMGGVRARSCRIEQVTGPDATPAAAVTITVAAAFGLDLVSVTARVRQMVIAAADQALGIPVLRVDIEVVDVFEDDPR